MRSRRKHLRRAYNVHERPTSADIDKPVFFGIDPYDDDVYIYPNAVPTLNTLIFSTADIGRAWLATSLLIRMRRAGYNVRVTIVDPRDNFKDKMLDALGLKRIVVGKTGYADVFQSENAKEIDELIERTSGGELCGLEELKQRFAPLFVGDVLPFAEAKDVAISFADVAKNPTFMRVYITSLAYQLYFRVKPKNREIWIIIFNINSTHIDKKFLRYLMLYSAAKPGIAIWLITDDADILTDEDLLKSAMIKILICGLKMPDLVRRTKLWLSPEEINWLFGGRGGPSRGVPMVWTLLIHGPSDSKRHRVFTVLERIK